MVSQLTDRLLPFQLDRSGLRGRLVRLETVAGTIVGYHDYPEPLARLVAEFVVLGATLAGGLKFDGSFSLQAKGKGPVSLIIADVTNAGEIRCYAHADAAAIEALDGDRLDQLLGGGFLAVTVDQSNADGETYQSIVDLEGASLSECMLAYFRTSDQVQTAIQLALSHGEEGWRGSALVIQRIADEDRGEVRADDAIEDWRRTMLLLSTLTEEELLDPELSDERLLFRLFHEEGVRVFDTQRLSVGCRCSTERIDRLLQSFSDADLDDMVDETGDIAVTCHFCNKTFVRERPEV